jgi:dihydroorotase
LGSDSAPHPAILKTTSTISQGCAAGIYTSPILLPLLAHLLESFGALDKLEQFVSTNGRQFYGFPASHNSPVVKLCRTTKKVDFEQVAGQDVIPFWAGRDLRWKITEVKE